jgi:hypothetical protein
LTDTLFNNISSLIYAAKARVAQSVNRELVHMYWRIGSRIRQSIGHETRAEYGKQIMVRLGKELTIAFGRGFNEASLSRMVRLVEIYPDPEILATLWQELSWSHFRELMPIKDDLERDFYAEMCRIERWSVRGLRTKIDGMDE